MTTSGKLFKIHSELNAIIMTDTADITPVMLARLEDAEEIIDSVRNELATITP